MTFLECLYKQAVWCCQFIASSIAVYVVFTCIGFNPRLAPWIASPEAIVGTLLGGIFLAALARYYNPSNE